MKKPVFIRVCAILGIGAGVVFGSNQVRAEGTIVYVVPNGTGDGSSWENATSFEGAVNKGYAATEDFEIWMKEGVHKGLSQIGYSLNKNVVIRGGFAGTETRAEERAEGTYSTVDGENGRIPMSLNVNKATEIERVILTKSSKQGLYAKVAAGVSLVLRDCRFVCNGTNANSQVDGRGVYIEGDKSSSEVRFEGCRFEGNVVRSNVSDGGYGNGAYLVNLKKAVMVDTVFLTNGYLMASERVAARYVGGAALYAESVCLAATNCSFIGNVGYSYSGSNSGALYSGGIVRMVGNCEGSVFDHCRWVGNRNVREYGYESDSSVNNAIDIGVLFVNNGDVSRTVTLESCTMAYNLCGSLKSAAGVNAKLATVNIHNSIFYGNLIPAASEMDNDVASVDGQAKINISWTMMDHEPTGTGVSCENLIVGVPQFVTGLEEFLGYVYTGEGSGIAYPKVDVDTFDMRFKTDAETIEKVLNMDVHVLSKYGYYKNDGKMYRGAEVFSGAIDTGDPVSGYENEGAPNGGRINLGVYGNTAQASLSVKGFCIRIR